MIMLCYMKILDLYDTYVNVTAKCRSLLIPSNCQLEPRSKSLPKCVMKLPLG